MNAIEIVAYKCSKCGTAYQSREYAEKCCMPKKCDDCGCEIPHNSYYVVCDSCRSKREAAKEKERFNKAIKEDKSIFTKEDVDLIYKMNNHKNNVVLIGNSYENLL